MGWELILHSDPGPGVRPFPGEEMLLMDCEKNEPHHFFEALFEAEMWNHIAHETNKYAKTRITQKCKLKQIFIVFMFFYFFTMLPDSTLLFFLIP